MGTIKLRDYQQRGVDALERLVLSGKRRVLAVAPTGAGKGTMAAHMLAETYKAQGSALFVVHRREILWDMKARLLALGVPSGVIMGDAKPERDLAVQLASVQTLIHERRRMDVDLMVVDEAHHYAADEWRQAGDHVRPYATVGFTATPQRADGRPLGDMFDYLVDVVSYSELLSRGDIVPCRVLRPEVPLGQDLADTGADAYLKYAPGRRAFIFTRGLIEAADCAGALNDKGVRARVVDTNTPDKEREETMRAMKAGELDVIVNYYTMAEGIDIPAVSCVVLARSVQHEGAYMQMVGRALRADAGKDQALVLDLCGASFTHGLPLDNRAYSLRTKGMSHAGGDVREHRSRRGAPEELPDVLHLQLVEATDESQRMWGKRRIDWDAVGFGEKTDLEIAREIGVSKSLVQRIRREKKLASVQRWRCRDIDWSQIDLAGKSDAQLSRDLGIAAETIRRERERLGIMKAFRGRGVSVRDVDWDREPLGKVSDKELAKRHNVSSSTVFLARTRRGIPPFQAQGHMGIDWDAQPYGQTADAELARKLGVNKKTVQRQREARDISPFKSYTRLDLKEHRAIDWNAVDFTLPDKVNADKLGVSPWSIRNERLRRGLPAPHRRGYRSGIDWDSQPLGQMRDADLAKQLGVHVQTVRIERAKRKIASVQPVGRPRRCAHPRAPVPKPARTRGYHAGIKWDAQPLGKETDIALARRLGVDVSSVRDQRVKRGIAALNAKRARVRPEESPPAPASSR